MSILIKGMEMEMPRNCWECEFNKSTFDRMDFCTLTNKQYNWGLSERPSDCPLIEVPEDVQPVKHGRWEEVQWIGGVVYSCSVCGRCAPWKELTTDQVCTEYCPDCGAKMDGEDNV